MNSNLNSNQYIITKAYQHDKEVEKNNQYGISKKSWGLLWGIFGFLICIPALLIGFLKYPRNSYARYTFVRGWTITF